VGDAGRELPERCQSLGLGAPVLAQRELLERLGAGALAW